MSLKTRILIIEDDEDDYIIMKHYLSKIDSTQYDVYWCNWYENALTSILENEHDIYLIDQFLGKGEGIEIIQQAREKGVKKPLLLLTGANNKEVDKRAMEVGASDYLVKNEVRSDSLERALRYAVERYNQNLLVLQKEKKYRSLFELSTQPILLLDKELNIIEFNNSFFTLFQEPNKKIFTNLEDYFEFHYDYDNLKAVLSREGQVRDFKTVLLRGDKEIVVILSVVRTPNNDVHTPYYQLVMQDVTKLVETEEEIKRLEKLSLSSRMARIIAHEVRNPLTNINLALGELKEVVVGNQDADLYNDLIKRNANRIEGLIEQLLYSTRPSELQVVSLDIKEVAKAALEECSDRLTLRKVEVVKDCPESPVTIHCDPEKLKIAFVNIIINGIEAMEDQLAPVLRFSITESHNAIAVTISDNGRGMDQETLKHLFDPFFTKRHGGLGLGMTATLSILNMHNATIKVSSELEKGTVFNLVFDTV